jgi:hypothetical protein
MAVSDRARAKGAQSARQLLPAPTDIRDYVVGRGNPRLTTGAIVACSIFACAFLVALAFGTVLLPGGLLLIYVIHAVRPPRAIVVADQGVAVLEKSFLNGRPTKVLAMIPAGMLSVAGASGHQTSVDFGAERISFAKREVQRLSAALAQPHTAPVPF